VPERRQRHRAHVVEPGGEPPVEQRARLGREQHGLRAPGRGAEAHVALDDGRGLGVVGVRVLQEAHRVVLHVPRDGHLAHQSLRRHDVLAPEHRRHLGVMIAGGAVENRVQLFAPGERHVQLEEEAVELRLGQRVGALALERVLRGEHEEGLFEPVGGARHGHRVLLHRLEQRRLRLRRRAVDLVGEHDVGENRPLAKTERPPARAGVLVDHRGAQDVGGHQVGRELHAREVQAERPGQRAHEQRLAEARHALEQGVRPGEHAGEHPVDDVAVAHDDFADFFAQALHLLAEAGDVVARGGRGHVGRFAHRRAVAFVGGAPRGGRSASGESKRGGVSSSGARGPRRAAGAGVPRGDGRGRAGAAGRVRFVTAPAAPRAGAARGRAARSGRPAPRRLRAAG
jgi:hypothetical protein